MTSRRHRLRQATGRWSGPRSGAAIRVVFAAGSAGLLLVAGACGTVPETDAAADQPPATSNSSATSAASAPASASGTPSASTGPSATPSTAPTSAAPAPVLERGAKGEQVRELQVRLRQLDWFSGTITGSYGKATVAGVEGFQDKRGFTVSGDVDATTWKKLVAMTRAPSHDEKYNILRPGPAIMKAGSSGDRVRDLQARLKQLDWDSGNVTGTYGSVTTKAVKGFQEKREIPVTGEVDQRTLSRLASMTHTPTSDEKHNRAPRIPQSKLDSRCLTGRAMCINKSTRQLVWVVNGKQQLRFDVRFGSELTPTREGTFSVGWKSEHHVSTIYHTAMPYAMFFSGGQAVHYSADFAARGYYGASHGCVNVRNLSGIRSLFSQVRVGDKVIVYRS